MNSTKEAFAEIGSVNDFVEKTGPYESAHTTLEAYTDALVQRRNEVAQSIGIAPDGLRIITEN